MLLGAHPLGDFVDGEHMQARIPGGIFREDFRGIVGTTVVGDPNLPLARVVLRQDRVERPPDTRRFVAGRNKHAHVRLGFHIGLSEAHDPEGTEEPHLEAYVEQAKDSQKTDDQVCEHRKEHFFGQNLVHRTEFLKREPRKNTRIFRTCPFFAFFAGRYI